MTSLGIIPVPITLLYIFSCTHHVLQSQMTYISRHEVDTNGFS